jgi:hypothetical protein
MLEDHGCIITLSFTGPPDGSFVAAAFLAAIWGGQEWLLWSS